ncbi:MAG: hypothetical protein R6X14_09685 [bacterium]
MFRFLFARRAVECRPAVPLAAVLLLAALLLPAIAGGSPLDPAVGAFLDTNLDSIGRLAFRACQRGNYLEAARRYLDLLRHDIHNADQLYKLACSYGLLGEPELAARHLVRAFRAGYRDIDHARRDPDFDLVADKRAFRRAIDSLARAAEDREHALGSRMLIAARSYLDCRVKLPLGYDPKRRYALIIGLHEHGSDHERFVAHWQRFGPDPQFIFACPRAPYAAPGGGEGFGWYTEADSMTRNSVRAASEEYILDVVRLLITRYNVGEVYLLGLTEGADIAWTAGLRHPRHFRGLVCIGGDLDTSRVRAAELENGRRLRVLIAHNREDERVGFTRATRTRDLLTGLDYDVTFHAFTDDHALPPEAARRVAEWLTAPVVRKR